MTMQVTGTLYYPSYNIPSSILYGYAHNNLVHIDYSVRGAYSQGDVGSLFPDVTITGNNTSFPPVLTTQTYHYPSTYCPYSPTLQFNPQFQLYINNYNALNIFVKFSPTSAATLDNMNFSGDFHVVSDLRWFAGGGTEMYGRYWNPENSAGNTPFTSAMVPTQSNSQLPFAFNSYLYGQSRRVLFRSPNNPLALNHDYTGYSVGDMYNSILYGAVLPESDNILIHLPVYQLSSPCFGSLQRKTINNNTGASLTENASFDFGLDSAGNIAAPIFTIGYDKKIYSLNTYDHEQINLTNSLYQNNCTAYTDADNIYHPATVRAETAYNLQGKLPVPYDLKYSYIVAPGTNHTLFPDKDNRKYFAIASQIVPGNVTIFDVTDLDSFQDMSHVPFVDIPGANSVDQIPNLLSTGVHFGYLWGITCTYATDMTSSIYLYEYVDGIGQPPVITLVAQNCSMGCAAIEYADDYGVMYQDAAGMHFKWITSNVVYTFDLSTVSGMTPAIMWVNGTIPSHMAVNDFGTIFAVVGILLFKSDDMGQTWANVQSPWNIMPPPFSYDSPIASVPGTQLFAVDGGDVTVDSGLTWTGW
jgi:hypothetical protein